jgi:hypothetical protein
MLTGDRTRRRASSEYKSAVRPCTWTTATLSKRFGVAKDKNKSVETIRRNPTIAACTRYQPSLICIPKHVPAVGSSPVSADPFSRTVCALASTRFLVFVLVAFPPPPLTTPANEAQLALSDCATSKGDQLLEARPVFIRELG